MANTDLMRSRAVKTFPVCFLITVLIAIPFSVQAAVVVLKNGDRITGRVVRMQDKQLEIDPEFSSNNVTVHWEDVRSITTDRPMSIKLHGGVEIPENVGQRVRDRLILDTLEEGGPIRLQDVHSINLAEQDYEGYISAGGNQTTGNSQTQAINLSGNLTYRKEKHRIRLNGKYNRAESSEEVKANNGSANFKYDHFLTRQLFTIVGNLSETDQLQDLSLRNSTYLGPGYDILASKQLLLSVAAGPAAVYQAYFSTPATITPSATWQLQSEIRFRGDDVILFHRHEGFKDLGHGSGTRFNAYQGIRIKIVGRWRVNLEYDLRWNSLPIEGRRTTDTNIIFSISFDLKP